MFNLKQSKSTAIFERPQFIRDKYENWYASKLNQVVPKPKFIRDTMNVDDIVLKNERPSRLQMMSNIKARPVLKTTEIGEVYVKKNLRLKENVSIDRDIMNYRDVTHHENRYGNVNYSKLTLPEYEYYKAVRNQRNSVNRQDIGKTDLSAPRGLKHNTI